MWRNWGEQWGYILCYWGRTSNGCGDLEQWRNSSVWVSLEIQDFSAWAVEKVLQGASTFTCTSPTFKVPNEHENLEHWDFPTPGIGRVCHLRPRIAMERSSALFSTISFHSHRLWNRLGCRAVFGGISLITLILVIVSGMVLAISGIVMWCR